jgi:hypothetical protein
MSNIATVVAQLHQKHQELNTELRRLDQAIQVLSGLGGTSRARGGKRRLSAAARARIAAAQRARWAKWKKAKQAT